ncbi:MAG: hypothetical protein JXJ04_15420 [Spirochaetales bacterium]|nr:hypothetical protein [Spirochaetales bacterium]
MINENDDKNKEKSISTIKFVHNLLIKKNKKTFENMIDMNDHFSFKGLSKPIQYFSWVFESFDNTWAGVDHFLNKICKPRSLRDIRILFRHQIPRELHMFMFINKQNSWKSYNIAFETAYESTWVFNAIDQLNRGESIPLAFYTLKGEKRIIKAISVDGDGPQNPWAYFNITSDSTMEIQNHINDCSPINESGIRLLCPQNYPYSDNSLHLFCRKDYSGKKWKIDRKRASSGWFLDNLKGLNRGDYLILDLYQDHPDLNYFFVAEKV